MSNDLKVDICVIGAGPGGLMTAALASLLGAKTALIEKGQMGGDCLNRGCVPSKTLLAAAKAAWAAGKSGRFGVELLDPVIDFDRLRNHVKGVISEIAPNDSAERFESLGVKVIKAKARFTGPGQAAAGDMRISARRFVIATGALPQIPPIPGLGDIPFLTNETIFDLKAPPSHLIIIGGGLVGVEMAQAYRRLGAQATILEMRSILQGNDPELVDILRNLLKSEGIAIHEGAAITRVEKTPNGAALLFDNERVEGSHLLVAAGRLANVDGLDLEKAGVAYSSAGIKVDQRMRTANKKIFAIGDVASAGNSPRQFTHMASHHASIVIQNALFRWPARVDSRAIPLVAYTSPELAEVGLGEKEAKQRHGDIRILRWPFANNDRAIIEGQKDGLVKVIVTPKGRIVGASILGAGAGDLIQTWTLAISSKLKIAAVAKMIAPYPTLGEANKRAAESFYKTKLFSQGVKKLVRFLSRLG